MIRDLAQWRPYVALLGFLSIAFVLGFLIGVSKGLDWMAAVACRQQGYTSGFVKEGKVACERIERSFLGAEEPQR